MDNPEIQANNVFKTQDEDKQIKTHKTKKMSNMNPYNNPRVNSGAHEE